MRITSYLPACVGVATLLVAAPAAHAQLIDPNYVATSILGAVGDDVAQQIALSNVFTFYGTAYNNVFLSTNGNLNFDNNADFASLVFPTSDSGPTIAALWSDWFTGVPLPPNQNLSVAAMYYRQDASGFLATWDVRFVEDETIRATFQARLNPDNSILLGFGEIDTRYQQFGGDGAEANLTGLNAGDGVRNADGNVRNAYAERFTQRLYTFSGSAASGNYNVVVSAVAPEPGTMSLFATALLVGGAVVRQRHSRTAR